MRGAVFLANDLITNDDVRGVWSISESFYFNTFILNLIMFYIVNIVFVISNIYHRIVARFPLIIKSRQLINFLA